MRKIFENWSNKFRLHILLWSLFIFYESVVIGILYHVFGNPLTYLAHYLIIISLFYVNADLALPWSLQRRRHVIWRLPLVILLELSLFIGISYFTDMFLISAGILREKGPLMLNFQYALRTLYRDVYFMGFSTGYYFLRNFIKEKRKALELEKQHLTETISRQKAEQELTKAQNAFLKAQINPHFLFNTLDFVYHNIQSLSPDAAEAVVALADMMRFAIDADKMGDLILLGDEIEQVENLLFLSQIRKPGAKTVRLVYDPAVLSLPMIPLVLLTLAENIFKHGDLSNQDEQAKIRIYIEGAHLHLETRNLIGQAAKTEKSNRGLNNISDRIKFAYGPDIHFEASADQGQHFVVSIAVPIETLRSVTGFQPAGQMNTAHPIGKPL